MNTAYLLLGSNLGNKHSYLTQAAALLEKKAGKVKASSSIYRTAPWGNKDQSDFLNQAVCIETFLSAEGLLAEILSIEKQLGRNREKKWESREIDIDIIFYNNELIHSPQLTIPHPHLQERRFALVPLAEIAKGLLHPRLKKTVGLLLEECTDPLEVKKQS